MAIGSISCGIRTAQKSRCVFARLKGTADDGGQLTSDEAAFVRLTASEVASGQQEVTGVCVHGTSLADSATILSTSAEGGIIPGSLSRKRKHTHCSQYPLSDARMTAGMRRDATEVEIFVRLSTLLGDGIG